MKNYKLIIQYEGTKYRGWQSQENTSATIQGKIATVCSKLDGHEVEINGAGRTDAGVHAKAQVANVKMANAKRLKPKEIKEYLNEYLPEDIAVLSVEEMPAQFHARLNAKGKTYMYRIWNSPDRNVFERKYTLHIEEPLDVERMQDAADYFVGTHDFISFSSVKKTKKSTVRTIYSFEIEEEGSEIQFIVHGDGFLYNMIRIMVGTLVEVGLGERTVDSVLVALESQNRELAGPTIEPQGLTMMEVDYEALEGV